MPTLREDLVANGQNPRSIAPHKLAALKRTLAEFGDLGGIIKNVHESQEAGDMGGLLIGGHQRVAALESDPGATVVVEKHYKEPTATGTVAEGYVLAHGERFSYREVAWPRSKAISASIAANKSAGAWDETLLTEWMTELQAMDVDLDLTMFDEDERVSYLPDEHDLAAVQDIVEDAQFTESDGDGPNAPPSFLPNPNSPVAAHVKQVQLFFDEKAHAHFMKVTDELKSIYGHDNLSDTVMDAVNRAGVTAALS